MTIFTNEAAIEDSLQRFINADRLELNTCIPGFVESFNPDDMTADITIPFSEGRAAEFGEVEEIEWPVLPGVPVWMPGGGPITIKFPLKNGDPVLVIFCQRSIAEWWLSDGREQVWPEDLRLHPESAAICLPRLFPQGAKKGDGNDSDLIIQHEKGVDLRITASGELQVKADKVRLGSLSAGTAIAKADTTNSNMTALQVKIDAIGAILGVPPLGVLPSVSSNKVFTDS